ncbi:hypothetical protein [Cytobacillus pseudoceanisediminis]|uniref:hypothetical protein n=1 Tax=Cytobacillus pseudoceanisediminis TaxID=3051614 RepID=UPI003CF6D7CF
MSEYPKPKIMIHMAGSRPVMKVQKRIADNWRRLPYQKLIKEGNTIIFIHSNLGLLSDEQRKKWFKIALEKKHPALMSLERTLQKIYPNKKVKLVIRD